MPARSVRGQFGASEKCQRSVWCQRELSEVNHLKSSVHIKRPGDTNRCTPSYLKVTDNVTPEHDRQHVAGSV